jgi:diguanylate cyclase (GGDEF)-like protein
VLAELSQMMTTLLRTEDVLARFGGEEFTILCRGSDLSGAKIVAERVRKAVEERKFSFGGKDIP